MPSALTILQAYERVLEPEAPIQAGRPPRRRAEEQIPQLRKYLGLPASDGVTPRVLDAAAAAREEECGRWHPEDDPTEWGDFDRCPGCGEQREALIDQLRARRSG